MSNQNQGPLQPIFNQLLQERNDQATGAKVRQQLIHDLEELLPGNGRLIVYTAAFFHPAGALSNEDILPFDSLLRTVVGAPVLYMMINSPGGDGDTAEEIVKMFRDVCGEKPFKIIVPVAAKSAATLISLSSDHIYMGYLSRLGPIDPQMIIRRPGGEIVVTPARSYIESFNKVKKEIENLNRIPLAYLPILNNIDIAQLDFCEKAIERSRSFAEQRLKAHMLHNDPTKAESLANELTHNFPSHGQGVDPSWISDPQRLGNGNVTKLSVDDPLWQKILELHCRSELFLRSANPPGVKLYESTTVSTITQVRA